ncbi:MAG: MBL fold metallo-hydrolase [Nocardiopsaceae bacterium]|nr:MBL fold metallo-hydrolase [Nocardiopsaceae bacterium]
MSTAISSRLVVLGGCGAWPEGGRACSGFVLEHDGYRVVLDLGYGTLPRLLALLGSPAGDGVDAVIVTHRHPDHMADLHGLFRARWFGRRGAPVIPLYAPDGVLARTAAMEDDGAELLGRVFRWHPLPAGPYRAGPFRLESVLLPHWVPNAGIRLSAPGLTVAYTGDTGPDPALPGLGRDADLYLVDATSREAAPGPPPGPDGPELLLNAREAGRAAAQAGARRLLLTHFWPGSDRAALAAVAAAEFGGPVLVADEGLEITLR